MLNQFFSIFEGWLFKSILLSTFFCLFALLALVLLSFYNNKSLKSIYRYDKQSSYFELTLRVIILCTTGYLCLFPLIFSILYALNVIFSFLLSYSKFYIFQILLNIFEFENNFLEFYLIFFGVLPLIIVYLISKYMLEPKLSAWEINLIGCILTFGYLGCFLTYYFSSTNYFVSLSISLAITFIYSYIIYILKH